MARASGTATPSESEARRARERSSIAVWAARAAWLLVAVIGGGAVESALGGRSDPVIVTATVAAWAGWAVVGLALAIASTRSLTVARIGVPLSVVVTVVAAFAGAGGFVAAISVVLALAASFTVGTAEFGRAFVQASAYGDEERFPLRMPAAAGIAAIVLWVPWAAAVVACPMLLAARLWIVGAVVTVAAVAGTVLLVPRWHRLATRWFVLVPAGVVVHDPVVLADTLPLRTAQVARLRLAPADTEAADLTGPASGYAVELTTTESITAVFAFTPSHPNGRAIHFRAMLLAPSRPGQALRAAHRRGLPVE